MSLLAIVVDVISWTFILVGAFLVVVGAVGIVRLPQFYSRLHAAGVMDTGGAELLLIGLAIQALEDGLYLAAIKVVIIGVFLFFTSPTATHAIANAAYVAGLRPDVTPREDEPGKGDAL